MTFLCFHITTFLFIFCKQHYGRQNFTFVSLCWQFFCLTSLKVSPGSSDVVKLCASLLCGASLQWDSETVKGEQAGWRSDWSTVNKKLQHSTKSIKSTLYRKFQKLLQPKEIIAGTPSYQIYSAFIYIYSSGLRLFAFHYLGQQIYIEDDVLEWKLKVRSQNQNQDGRMRRNVQQKAYYTKKKPHSAEKASSENLIWVIQLLLFFPSWLLCDWSIF